jgi:hypothetical protein
MSEVPLYTRDTFGIQPTHIREQKPRRAPPSSVRLNQDTSFLPLKKDFQYKLTVHLRPDVSNEAPNWTQTELDCRLPEHLH